MDKLYRPAIPNDTIGLIQLWIAVHPNHTHEDIVAELAEPYNKNRIKEIANGVQWLIQNDYVRQDKRTQALTIRE